MPQHPAQSLLLRLSFPDGPAQAHRTAQVAGVDEAGRGPLAGPVVAAAVIFHRPPRLPHLKDSKQLSPLRRNGLFSQIQDTAAAYGIGICGVHDITTLNILGATFKAMRQALHALAVTPDLVIVDGNHTIPGWTGPQQAWVKGDQRHLSVAAASILAKVTRDRIMEEYDALYPAYGFARHKGYGTADHLEALRRHGPCPIHRNFAPVLRLNGSLQLKLPPW